MTDAIRLYLPWLLSVITIWMTLMAGNKHPQAWLPQTLWELLRKHGLALDKAQAICNDAMKNGVSTPCDAVSEEAVKP